MQNFKLEFSVRDYECDLQKIVNNAVYFNYLEHTRHEFLKNIGINFFEMHKKGIDLVVIRAEIDYKASLKSGDKFYVTAQMKSESRITLAFYQNIYRIPDDKLIVKAKIIGTGVSIASGRPVLPNEIKMLLK